VRNYDWASAWIQWIGTIFFISTTLRTLLDATGSTDPSATQIWRPDAVGSILFLVSSAIVLKPAVRRRRHRHARDRSWAIAAINMLGSIFFGISAVGAYVDPDTGQVANLGWADGGTFLGALCFLVGALLVLPPMDPATTPPNGRAHLPAGLGQLLRLPPQWLIQPPMPLPPRLRLLLPELLPEVLAHLPRLLRLRKAFRQRVLDWKPDVYIGIDAPDFNLGVERVLKERDVRTGHDVSPSVLAWPDTRAPEHRPSPYP